jgi:transposase
MKTWTDEEISTLVSMWPTHTVRQIANTLHRSRAVITERVKRLRERGLLKAKNPPRCRSIKPDPQDFDEVKRDYCRKHGIKLVELCARLEGNNQLAAELYALAQGRQARKVAPKAVKVGGIDRPAAAGTRECGICHVRQVRAAR